MNAWDIERIKEIMKERGLKASDFYRDDNYGTDTQFARILGIKLLMRISII